MRKWMCIVLCFLMLLPVTAYATEDSADGNTQSSENTCSHSYSGWSVSGGNHVRTCSGCGDTESASHTYSSWTASGENHIRACSVCGHSESGAHTYDAGNITTPATCSAAGVKTFTCTTCPATRTESVGATGTHVYQNGQKVDDTNHKLTCPGCNGEITEAHSWNAGQVTVNATCQAAGKKVYTCTKCPATKEEVIPQSTTHTYGSWTTDNENHTRTCSVCSKVDSGKHSWGTGTVVTAATCKEAGVTSYTCSGCNTVKYEDVAKKTTHTYDNDCDDTCNVCEQKREAAHKFSEAWTKNGSGHWHACLVCGEKKEHLDHVPGPAATEYKEQTCLTCGYVLTARKNHTHTPQNDWKSDRNGHWHTCSGCEVELDFEKHDFGPGCDGCTDCGFVDPTKHIYDGSWESDRLTHWGVCKVCGSVSELQDHIPGPEATKDAPQTCTVCDYVLSEFQEHEHVPTNTWLSNDAEHWRVCECGERLDVDPHIWDEGVKNKDKTITYNCAMCDETKTEPLVEERGGFPWGALLVMLIVLLIAAFATLAWILLQPKQKGKFTHQK